MAVSKPTNKKNIYIIITLIIFIILLSLVLVFITHNGVGSNNTTNTNINSNEINKLVLYGEKEITLEEGSAYSEPGYYAISKTGKILTDQVEVTNQVNVEKVGTYVITYTIQDKKQERTVVIVPKKEGEITLTLNGEALMTLEVGSQYIEPGYEAIDTVDGNITDSVEIDGEVNTEVPGTYKIIYSVTNSANKQESKERTIVVTDNKLEVLITPTVNLNQYTSDDIVLNISIIGNSFSYIKLPDDTISSLKVLTYKIIKNGNYKFYIYDKNSNYIVKEINIKNIDRAEPVATCKVTISNNKSSFSITASDDLSGIKNYTYYDNDKLLETTSNNKYTVSKVLTNASVLVTDNVSNSKKINCSIDNNDNNTNKKYDYLEMHFIISGYNDDAILIRTSEATILIDTGRKGTEKRVIPYLQGLGVKTINAIIGSHPHYNHIQAQAFIIEKFNVKKSYYSVDLNTCVSKHYCEKEDILYIKDAIKNNNIPMQVTKAGETIKIGDMTLYFIGPYALNSTSKYMQNANSSIFILKYKNNTFMFTGDTGGTPFTLSKLKQYTNKLGISLKVDMLKYPHHGNASIPTDLLNAISPKYVIIPNYKYSKYPTSSNKSKLKNIGAKVYQNATDGNIVLISDGKNISVKKNQEASSYAR